MKITLIVGVVFACLALVFLGLAWRDYLKEQGRKTISRNVWLRLAFIFAAVGIGLSFLHVLTQ
jgi:H+/Cl- antiporter ClcA